MARQSTHQTKPNPEKTPRRDPTASGQRDAAVNRIASHNYFLLEKFEVGVALTGTEVKSVRGGLANLKDSYGLIKDGNFGCSTRISALMSMGTFIITLRCGPASC